MSERDHNENVDYDQNGESVKGQSDLTDEQRDRRRQEHNEAVHHGGVAQIGDFDPEEQQRLREEERERIEGRGAYLNENDPALPTVGEDTLGDVDDDDRPADEIRERQGDNPGAQG